MAVSISQLIENNATDNNYNPYPNVDLKYGPHASVQAALTAIAQNRRAIGLTVGILDAQGHIDEYWFKNGITDADLVLKITGSSSSGSNSGGSEDGGHDLIAANSIVSDSNAAINLAYPNAHVKDVIVDKSTGSVYIQYAEGKWVKCLGEILDDNTPTVASVRDVKMLSMK